MGSFKNGRWIIPFIKFRLRFKHRRVDILVHIDNDEKKEQKKATKHGREGR